MKKTLLTVSLFSLMLAACGKQDEQQPQVAPATTETPSSEVSQPVSPAPPEVEDGGADPSAAPLSEDAAVEGAAPPAPPAAEAEPAPPPVPAIMSQDDALVLANRSGCLACHAVYKKVVGPAWQDVAARYRDKDVRTQLIEKVRNGGTGNWTDVTGGIPMPPYSPRVADGDIGRLVDFILSL